MVLKTSALPRSETSSDAPASWSNLPRKGQLFVLAFCRVFDFMQVASFQTICYYQLKSFGSDLPEHQLSWQSGVASGSFSAAQIFTAVIWGWIADAAWVGRKRVLMMGLWGTAIGCVGLAFSRSFFAVVIFRLLAGASNVFCFSLTKTSAFGNLLPLFLSSPRKTVARGLPFVFNGGLGMAPRAVGLALAILGAIGILLQFLIYPRINTRLGNVQCFRIFCILFPIAYALAPFLAVVPTDPAYLTWVCITLVIAIHTTGRIFVLPATIVLLNNCAPDPSVLGMVHGVGQTTSALFRTLGPVSAGWMFGKSFESGVIGAVWWGFAVVAVFGWVASLFVWERPAG
ncbi:hypothetical protein PZA11_001148 [Diplocarpon coronariae]